MFDIMDTMEAYNRCLDAVSKGNKLKCLNLEKLHEYVEKQEKEIQRITAGIDEDWEYTGDTIYKDDEWIDDNMSWTRSLWGTPIAYIDYADDSYEEFTEYYYEEVDDD